MLEITEFNKIIVANWKQNGSLDFIRAYFKDLFADISNNPNVCTIFCPPMPYLQICYLNIKKRKSLFLGAQDCSLYNLGAFTGETSASMLKDNNCQFCIVGHSERRQLFSQTNLDTKNKAENLVKNDINPIICIGETLDEKDKGLTKNVLQKQIMNSLPKNSSIQSVIIAYEPIWAIGTGLTPTLNEIEDIHFFIKKGIKNFTNHKIIYGGSVKSKNAKDIMDLENVDGVLVGGSSLDPLEFIKILNS